MVKKQQTKTAREIDLHITFGEIIGTLLERKGHSVTKCKDKDTFYESTLLFLITAKCLNNIFVFT